MSDNQDMREFWNGPQGEKWVEFQTEQDTMLEPLGLRVMEALELDTGETVIDIGCGCGTTSLHIAERVAPDGHVLGLDISAVMLARARELAQAKGAQARFEHGDVEDHDLPAGRYDAAFSRFGVMFFENPARAFKNVFSALRTGGRIAFVCWRGRDENPWFNVAISAARKYAELPPPPDPEDPGIFSFADPERVKRLLSEAGFDQITMEKMDVPIHVAGAKEPEEAADFILEFGGPLRPILEDLTEDAFRQLYADITQGFADFRTQNGIIVPAATWLVRAHKPG